MLNLDTHILIAALRGELSQAEEKVLKKKRWGISDIVLWELIMLISKGRLAMDLRQPEIERFFETLEIWPISLKVCQAIAQLDFKSDPADEIIAATSLAHRVPLLTRDRKMTRSKVVPLAV